MAGAPGQGLNMLMGGTWSWEKARACTKGTSLAQIARVSDRGTNEGLGEVNVLQWK